MSRVLMKQFPWGHVESMMVVCSYISKTCRVASDHFALFTVHVFVNFIETSHLHGIVK